MPELTVIMPVYNVAAYLKQTLASLQQQTMSEFKVIIVNDGSTDETGAIAKAVCARDSRFTLVTTPHRSAAHAKNVGVQRVTTPYVTFVDGDDVLDPTAFAGLVPLLKQMPDLIISDIAFDGPGNQERQSHLNLPPKMDQAAFIAAFPQLYAADGMFYNCNKVYRQTLLQPLTFQNLPVGEDTVLNYQYFYQCSVVLTSPSAYYHYQQRVGSAVNHYDEHRLAVRATETAALCSLLNQWHSPATATLITADWLKTLTLCRKNIYFSRPDGTRLSPPTRLKQLHEVLVECLRHIDEQQCSSSQRHQIEQYRQLLQDPAALRQADKQWFTQNNDIMF
ncbi:glycosyltransferase family 2 protein [Ligilactobacillus sp. LYQ139]|uniref:glycosyltransferase family 2 protein n=1 Tax=Ligilactobacillus sp. LYQ139 TaxID=3378800 RepID=UPI0038539D43